jgi:maltose alpha-D-glucosyltransferase/alpha-amylase
MSEQWYLDTVFYELYLRALQDSNDDGHGDFRGAMSRLDYIKSLGVECIWILPHYPSPLADDGYDVADYIGVHPDYGTLEDFQAFVAAAHERGLRVIIDLVMNHCSDQHPWFQAARQDRNSPYHDYFVWSDTGEEYADARIIFLDTEKSNWTYDEVAGRYFWHRFYSSQPDLNYDNPAVHEEMFNIIRFWLDTGVDGFRADAVPYLIEREGTNCENLPETHDFLKKVRRLIDSEYPGRVLIAEANQWPDDLLPYFGEGDEFHICFHFPIMPRLYMALKQADKTAIVDILARTPAIPAGTQWMTFLRNHDELTLEMVTPAERQWMWEQYAPKPRMRLNMGIRRRLAPLLDNHPDRWFLLNALHLSLPGTPIIYYGDEIGMGDDIWLPDRHGCRTPMQWNAEFNAGFSNAETTYFPVISDPVFGYQYVNVALQEMDEDSYLWRTRKLIKTRQHAAAVRRGAMTIIPTKNPAILAYWRTLDDERVLCLYNLSQHPQPLDGNVTGTYQDLLHPEQHTLTLTPGIELPGYATHWLNPIP